MNHLTENELFEKYGSVIVKFEFYYKYTFWFYGTLENGNTIKAAFGPDDIYRLNVTHDQTFSIASLYPDVVYINDKDGKLIESYYS